MGLECGQGLAIKAPGSPCVMLMGTGQALTLGQETRVPSHSGCHSHCPCVPIPSAPAPQALSLQVQAQMSPSATPGLPAPPGRGSSLLTLLGGRPPARGTPAMPACLRLLKGRHGILLGTPSVWSSAQRESLCHRCAMRPHKWVLSTYCVSCWPSKGQTDKPDLSPNSSADCPDRDKMPPHEAKL